MRQCAVQSQQRDRSQHREKRDKLREASLDANKPLINAAAGVVLALVLAAASFRTVSVNPDLTLPGSEEVAAIKAKKAKARAARVETRRVDADDGARRF